MLEEEEEHLTPRRVWVESTFKWTQLFCHLEDVVGTLATEVVLAGQDDHGFGEHLQAHRADQLLLQVLHGDPAACCRGLEARGKVHHLQRRRRQTMRRYSSSLLLNQDQSSSVLPVPLLISNSSSTCSLYLLFCVFTQLSILPEAPVKTLPDPLSQSHSSRTVDCFYS